jgi:protoporphyrinogen oxidase
MNIAIVGGGLSGISLAYSLLRSLKSSDIHIHLFERESVLGGLCHTIRMDQFYFDFGPHNVHSNDRAFHALMVSMLGDPYRHRDYRAQVAFMGKFVLYPMQGLDILKCIPLTTSIACASSFLFSRLRSVFRDWDDGNLEEYLINRFGPRLYSIYFGPFTEKTWGVPGSQISADFARERIGTYDLWELFKRTFLGITPRASSTGEDAFFNRNKLYHDYGSQPVIDAFASHCLADPRFTLHLSSGVTALDHSGDFITAVRVGEETVRVDYVFSSISLSALASMLDIPSSLTFTSTRFLFMTINKTSIFGKVPWVYFSDSSTIFNRVYEPRNMSPRMAPDDKTSLCFEFTSTGSDSIWRMTDGELLDAAVSGLAPYGLLNGRDVMDYVVHDKTDTYPLRLTGYKDVLSETQDHLSGFTNLTSYGRLGGFQHLNMDHCVILSSSVASQFAKVANSILR